MLIGSRFKRPKAPVELPGKTYYFTPVDPNNAESEHVAEVTDTDHIGTLLAIPEGYYVVRSADVQTTSKPVAKTQAPAPAATVSKPADSTPPADTEKSTTADSGSAGAEGGTSTPPADDTAVSGLSAELEEAAVNLNALSWQKLQAEINKGDLAPAVLRRAYEIELAKPEDDQRGTTIKILKKALGIA
ncbi:MAG TPA: hypothetical protein VGE09_06225 [Pseudoxanthomonas sp.]